MKEEREMRTSPWGLIPTARRQAGKQEVAAMTATSCLLAGEEGGKEKKGICPENPLGFSVFRETLKQQLLAFFRAVWEVQKLYKNSGWLLII